MRRTILTLLGVFSILFLGTIYFLFFSQEPPMPNTNVVIAIRDTPIEVELAETLWEKVRGLSGRDHLAEGRGMLFLYDTQERHGMWMKDMKFPIDILWIKNSAVVDLEENAKPEPGVSEEMLTRYIPDVPADLVLEVPAGFLMRHAIVIGDKVHIISSALPEKYQTLLLQGGE